MDPNYLKAFHLIAMVAWFSGTFYLVRLFIYDKEADKKDGEERAILQKQFRLMERRLWFFITWPAFILLLFFGFWLLINLKHRLGESWMHIKLGLLALMFIYHLINHRIYSRIQKGILIMGSFKLRLWNEVATLLLVSIVLVAVFKPTEWLYGLLGFLLFATAVALGIFLNKKFKKKDIDEAVEQAIEKRGEDEKLIEKEAGSSSNENAGASEDPRDQSNL